MTLRPGEKSLTPTGNPNNYYTKAEVNTALSGKADTATTLAGYGITDGANTALNNLNSDGQKIVDTANGTISNCILEIPQNIKLELSNNVLTLKAGSTVVLTGPTYTTSTNTSDISRTLSLSQGRYYIWRDSSTTIATPRNISDVTSGTTPPETATINYGTFYNIDDKYCYQYTSNGWIKREAWSYPLCIIDVDSQGNASFAKDSNGNDMIFNGACFIGHHAVVYPFSKYLLCNGINSDGTMNSDTGTLDSLQIRELVNNRNVIALDNNLHLSAWKKVDKDKNSLTSGEMTYVASENLTYGNNGSSIAAFRRCFFVDFIYNGTTVTDFTIRQPVRTATVEMLDKKQDAITTITGYNATKTQTLKNVSGTLTWVDD